MQLTGKMELLGKDLMWAIRGPAGEIAFAVNTRNKKLAEDIIRLNPIYRLAWE